MDKQTEETLELPWEVVDECNGFGLDFGGSVCKVVYLHKDDWQETGNRDKPTVCIRCVRFARSDFDKALDYLKDRVLIRRKTADEKPLLYITGIGGSQFSTKICEMFNIRTSVITEFECIIAAFNYALKTLTRGQLLQELDQNVVQKTIAKNIVRTEMDKKILEDATNFTPVAEPVPESMKYPQGLSIEKNKKMTDYEDLFPCFVVLVGSGAGVMLLKEDGTYELANDIKIAGRTFLGLGNILTGSKSYYELMSKAEAGTMTNVHQYISEIGEGIDATTNDNIYGVISDIKPEDDFPGFLFGKCVSKDIGDFSQDDLARSFLHMMVVGLVSSSYVPLRVYQQVKHVFFIGGFPDHPLTRDLIVEEWIEQEATASIFYNNKNLHHTHFMKHASHFGALGAYLNQKLKFIVNTDK